MTKDQKKELTLVNPDYLQALDKQLGSIQRHLTISRRIIKRLQPTTRKGPRPK